MPPRATARARSTPLSPASRDQTPDAGCHARPSPPPGTDRDPPRARRGRAGAIETASRAGTRARRGADAASGGPADPLRVSGRWRGDSRRNQERELGDTVSLKCPPAWHSPRRPSGCAVIAGGACVVAEPAAQPDEARGGAAAAASSQCTSAHTTLLRWLPHIPMRVARPRTRSRPRPCSPSGSSTIRGVPGEPPSATATRMIFLCSVTPTAKEPPCPLAVWRIALLASSVAMLFTSSRAGQSGSSDASHCRTALSWHSSPGKCSHHRGPGTGAGRADGTADGSPAPRLAVICAPRGRPATGRHRRCPASGSRLCVTA